MIKGFKLAFIFFSFLFLFGLLLTTDTPEPVAQEISEEITPGKTCPPNQFLVSGEFCTDSDGDPFTCQICDYCGNGIPTSASGNIEACDQAPGGPIVVNPDSAGCESGQDPIACNNCELVCDNCGNDQIDPGETCDGINFNPPNINNNECISCHFCGDGIPDSGEACDDGDSNNFNACSNVCVESICGDGIIQDPNIDGTTEQCDQEEISQELIDLGLVPDDVICLHCEAFYCGDGEVGPQSPLEQCDGTNVGDVDGDGEYNTPADHDQAVLEQIVGCDINCYYIYDSDLEVTKFAEADGVRHDQSTINDKPEEESDCIDTALEAQISNGDVIKSGSDVIFGFYLYNSGEVDLEVHTITDPDLAALLSIPDDTNLLEAPFTLLAGANETPELGNIFQLPRGLHHNSVTIGATRLTDLQEIRTTAMLDICVSGCGDGVVDTSADEDCEPGDPTSVTPGNICGADCKEYTIAVCGNGILENPNFPPDIDEFCDGNEIVPLEDSGLSSIQYSTAVCSNNLDSSACGFSASCDLLYCGDGQLTEGEACDVVGGSYVKFTGTACETAPLDESEYCGSDCQIGGCGDEVWKPSKEECDESAALAGLPIMPPEREAAGYTCSNCLLSPPESPTPTPTDTMPPPPSYSPPTPTPSCPPDGYVSWQRTVAPNPYSACMYAVKQPDSAKECCASDKYYDRNCQDDICGFLPTRTMREWCRYNMRTNTPCDCVNEEGEAACVQPYESAHDKCDDEEWNMSGHDHRVADSAPCEAQAMRVVSQLDNQQVAYFELDTCQQVNLPPDGEICDSGLIIHNSYVFIPMTKCPLSLNFGPEKPWTLTKFKLDPNQEEPWVIWKGSSNRPLLVYDPEQTGEIKDASQLFGNWTFHDTNIARKTKQKSEGKDYLWEHGFHALKELDYNKDGWLRNYVFEKDELDDLALWFDNNQNGISDPGEVRSLDDFDITGINTNFDQIESHGNIVSEQGFERTIDGNKVYGQTIDWFTASYPDRHTAILDYMKKSKSKIHETQFQAGLLEILENNNYIKDQLTGRNKKLDGEWRWNIEDQPEVGGVLSLNVVDGQLNGYSLTSRTYKHQQTDHTIVAYHKFDLAGNLLTSNAQYDTYLMKIKLEQEITETYVIHDKSTDTLSAQSVEEGLQGQHSYNWVGTRK